MVNISNVLLPIKLNQLGQFISTLKVSVLYQQYNFVQTRYMYFFKFFFIIPYCSKYIFE